MSKSAKIVAGITGSLSVLLVIIRYLADLDFIVSRLQDPGWMMDIPAFFQGLHISDSLIGGLAILSLVLVLYVIRTSGGSIDTLIVQEPVTQPQAIELPALEQPPDVYQAVARKNKIPGQLKEIDRLFARIVDGWNDVVETREDNNSARTSEVRGGYKNRIIELQNTMRDAGIDCNFEKNWAGLHRGNEFSGLRDAYSAVDTTYKEARRDLRMKLREAKNIIDRAAR